jgi:transaldolase
MDGYVSWEVDPNLAYDRDATTTEARRLHDWIDKPNLYVKIPATKPGLGSIEDMIAAGKNINVTLILSLRRYSEVVEAYISGLGAARRRLDAIGDDDRLRGKLGIANAKLAYQCYLVAFSNRRWHGLAAQGAPKQRCLWASTSTKNPADADVMYVEGLIGPETVNTMTEETIRAFQDHGRVAGTLTRRVGEAERLLEDLERVGVDYDDVVLTLEQEGVKKFVDSFAELLEGVQEKAGNLVTAGGPRPEQATPRPV